MSRIDELEEIPVVLYIIFCVISFGLFYLYWQYRQMKQCNILMEKNEHGLLKWMFLSLITFGIYHFYHEYKMSKDIIQLQRKYGLDESGREFPLLCLLVSVIGLFLISDFVHQEELNKIIRELKKR